MQWFVAALGKYAVFEGRAQRAEYWTFVLFALLITIALSLVDIAMGMYDSEYGVGPLSGLFGVATILPYLAVGARRLHDTGRTGWWLLAGLVPILGAIVLVWFLVQDSQPGTNAYGPNPKGVAAA